MLHVVSTSPLLADATLPIRRSVERVEEILAISSIISVCFRVSRKSFLVRFRSSTSVFMRPTEKSTSRVNEVGAELFFIQDHPPPVYTFPLGIPFIISGRLPSLDKCYIVLVVDGVARIITVRLGRWVK